MTKNDQKRPKWLFLEQTKFDFLLDFFICFAWYSENTTSILLIKHVLSHFHQTCKKNSFFRPIWPKNDKKWQKWAIFGQKSTANAHLFLRTHNILLVPPRGYLEAIVCQILAIPDVYSRLRIPKTAKIEKNGYFLGVFGPKIGQKWQKFKNTSQAPRSYLYIARVCRIPIRCQK